MSLSSVCMQSISISTLNFQCHMYDKLVCFTTMQWLKPAVQSSLCSQTTMSMLSLSLDFSTRFFSSITVSSYSKDNFVQPKTTGHLFCCLSRSQVPRAVRTHTFHSIGRCVASFRIALVIRITRTGNGVINIFTVIED